MPNPPDPDRDAETTEIPTEAAPDEQVTESYAIVPAADDAVTEVFTTETTTAKAKPDPADQKPPERRFTAPGFDAGETEIIPAVADAETEMIRRGAGPGKARPQLIPPRFGGKFSPSTPGSESGAPRSWGWVLALILIILTLAVIAVLGTVWLTRDSGSKASQEDRVRETIQNFDVAVQKGDLSTLRSITCGAVRDGYVNYNEQSWDDTYRRVEAARQYPVVSSIDEVVIDDDGRAEANVTAFMAYAPQVRSTRSFDLQYRDDQWKICQARTG